MHFRTKVKGKIKCRFIEINLKVRIYMYTDQIRSFFLHVFCLINPITRTIAATWWTPLGLLPWHQNYCHNNKTITMTPELSPWQQDHRYDTRTIATATGLLPWHQNYRHDNRTIAVTPELWPRQPDYCHDTRTIDTTPGLSPWHYCHD